LKVFHLSRGVLVYLGLSLGIPTIPAVVGTLWLLINPQGLPASERLIFLPFLAALLLVWWWMLRVPYRLTIGEDGSIELKAVLRTVLLHPHEIKSVKARLLQPGSADLKHEGGKVFLFTQIDGFYEFLWTLKKLNPSIEIRGC
jgi:hypothetical protein